MRNFTDQLYQAITALTDHRLRTVLSILGITIGIAAVIAVSTISRGGNHIVYSELETFGLNSIWVYRNWRNDSPYEQVRSGTGIDNGDYQAVKDNAEFIGIRHITPIVRSRENDLTVRRASRYANSDLIGVSESYQKIVNDKLVKGRGITRSDIREKMPVAVLAPEVASKLFELGVDPIGQSIRIGDKRLHVVGLLAGKSRDFLASIGSAGGENANDRVLVPYTVLQQFNGNDAINHFHISAAQFERAESVASSVKDTLQRRHRNLFEYASETMSSYIKTTDRILGGVAIIGIIAASISLLVGGMGIMNMMGTSVLERTREIGIRKAIGASERDILWQFLLEAIIISIIGGVLGLLVGGIASVVLAHIAGFPLIPSIATIIGALLVSVLVGVLSGFLPAWRAAHMQPVQALRSD